MSQIIKPTSSLVLPPSLQLRSVDLAGGFRKGEVLPLKGLFLVVIDIVANEDGMFRLVLAPIGLTKGAIKRANGKKGARNASPSPRANGRPVTYGRVNPRRKSGTGAERTSTKKAA